MLAFDFDLQPLTSMTGKYIEESESAAHVVPFEAWIDDCQRTILAVLQRTVVYEVPELDMRCVALFSRVMVDPASVTKKQRRKVTRAQYGRRGASGLAPRDCVRCGDEFIPLQGTHLYCSKTCQEGAWGDRAKAARASKQIAESSQKQNCGRCKTHKSVDAFKGLDTWCTECRSAYNHDHHLRTKAAHSGIIAPVSF